MKLPTVEGGWPCICADPPWHFQARTALQMENFDSRRDVEKHYQTMSIDEIKAMPVKDIAARDSHLFLWTTGPCLRQAFDVIEAWGYRYSSMGFVWIKQRRGIDERQITMLPADIVEDFDLHVGLGLTTRKNAEFVLLGRRGSARRNAANIREVIISPARQHSRKPDEAYDRIRRYCDGPYLELFSRESREGWSTWGNEATKFDQVQA